ncbi:MAG: type IX secretion system membrane protein PorP/SprF [Bacteroidia bacterium]|nr:type IX secretion system membrane protein PorP/SprF [Bacteroidia bacterium]NNF32301.1 type IX secretion system membrane protein PorP/SprF [Flavobacteriaceae bacterium]MBT8276101.1 type IX secretion system membrane protein PorP/SprF [Bacteroidia bacterium]NNJ83005.1 type IX secretion system membrane protein PorP/SprF [Flavobacteriaceae bacterium]NNK53927.1 type IX secretion system membrane protein PorP/SprF [Flavobacteriaceae bacterium]
MMIKKTYLILLLFIGSFVHAQDGIPVYSDYFADNLYLIHPSMAGAAAHNQLRLTARQQWFDQDEAPNLQTLSFNARLGERSGVGAIVFNDRNGYHSQTGGYLTYAHHIMFSRSEADLNQLSFGLSAGLVQSRLDETQFDPNDFDPIIAGIIQSSSYFNLDAGVSYNFLNFSGHFTVKNIIFQNRNLFSEKFEPNNQRQYLISAAYAISSGVYSTWAYEPSFMLQWRERTNESAIDVNFKVYRTMDFGKLWGGISYRRSFDGSEFLDGVEVNTQKLQYWTPIIGVNYNNWMFAYTYSYQAGNIRFQSGGFHQITLGYDFLGNRPEPYNCNCPAIN